MAGLIARAKRSRPNSRQNSRPIIAPDWQPPKADPLPYSKQKYFFSAAERSFYEILKRLASDHTVFARSGWQISYMSVRARQPGNRISIASIGSILTSSFATGTLPQLSSSSRRFVTRRRERQLRDEFMDQVLQTVALPIVHVRVQRGYKLDEVRQMLLPYLRVQSPAKVAHPDGSLHAARWLASCRLVLHQSKKNRIEVIPDPFRGEPI